MATIYLVRHGQASFGKENYDQLSPRGWEQGRILGRWLAGKVEPGAVFGGNLQRHRETVEAITTGYGVSLPDMQVLEGLNEFDHLEVVERLRPEWADKQVMARDLASFPKPARAFQQAFEKAVTRWVSGEFDQEYSETWNGFRQRVGHALDQLIELADGADVIVSTSGGPIAVIAQRLLELSDRKALEMNNVIANTSVSRILYSGPRRSLAVFNNYSHLEAEDPALVTFR
ncbi:MULTISPECIES: histidine phosphatase family protein [Marinobacter]|jgi:broad specificity phosphatase PhoE|uniref:Broad specificity phosphatase PhoE n=1 Tax=Marinobacter nauticus TaxID=2743 RepID=A0A368Y4Y5_MARNT|nr:MULTISPECIES: histidine phosphatase family protein [Marinobacter]MEC7433586.1 histidine phosphatase family protein [Pseudomonadota bacterium]ERS84815.1 phosphoglycerate kinase [Marinobacter sp. C1S70]MAC21727.1 histidine phosphatase family protein [Marinobacter sp.]MBH91734.1 histidine phosphatase family protein [Marinobacter sp.]MBN8240167.1 histidine phosphatase family protein [Marinobacter nauticus]|tara:strand:+ start:1215 stop:1904 length:690 start_codon:yes stop_codon:yes gene_type:complete